MKPSISPDDCLLTLDEFKSRAGVGKTTVYKWMGNKILIEDADYKKEGKIVRFTWPPVFLAKMKERKAAIIKAEADKQTDQPQPFGINNQADRAITKPSRGRRGPVDIDAAIHAMSANSNPRRSGRGNNTTTR